MTSLQAICTLDQSGPLLLIGKARKTGVLPRFYWKEHANRSGGTVVSRWSCLPKIYGNRHASEKHLTMTKTKDLGSRKAFSAEDPDLATILKALIIFWFVY